MLALDGQCHGGRSVEVGPQIPPEEPLAQAREQPMWEVLPVEPRSPHEVMLVHGTDTDDGSGDRKSVVSGQSVSVPVDIGGRRISKQKQLKHTYNFVSLDHSLQLHHTSDAL